MSRKATTEKGIDMKKVLVIAAVAALCAGMLSGCGASTSGSSSSSSSSSTSAEQSADVTMSYTTVDELKAELDSDDVVVVDVRKAADYEAGHIKGAVSADMDAAKAGDTDTGTANMKAALEEATSSETGDGKQLVLVCYSGKSYAQAGTNILDSMGADMTKVTTLEGGMEAWGSDDLEK